MTTQYIITGAILLFAFVYAVWKIVKYFGKPKSAASACEKFTGDCAGCKAHFSSTEKSVQECEKP